MTRELGARAAHGDFESLAPSSRMQSRDACECRFFFSSRDVCRERFVSLQERASRALFSRHARHHMPHMPEVTGVLSDQFVPGGEVDFQPSSETANVNGVAGAAIGGVAPPQETAMQIERSVTIKKRATAAEIQSDLEERIERWARRAGHCRRCGAPVPQAARPKEAGGANWIVKGLPELAPGCFGAIVGIVDQMRLEYELVS